MPEIFATISCNLDTNILLASIPLLEAEKVEALEWSFDTLYKKQVLPDWFTELLSTYSNANRLVGHGVYFSIFSAGWSQQQAQWLKQLEQLSAQFKFDHISEHFGFMTGENFHNGAPLSIPFNAQTLAIGQDRIKRIYNACKCTVGIENLAFAYSLDEVKKHGNFLDQLMEPVNGFIILDIHNLYCQTQNFNFAFTDLLDLYPLERVREMHISGGSWEDSIVTAGKKIRRDTHDDRVPPEVFQMLEYAIRKCPNLKFVVLEQLGNGLETNERRTLFQQDFMQLYYIVQNANKKTPQTPVNTFFPTSSFITNPPVENALLHAQQSALSNILETATGYENALQLLHASCLSNSDWEIEKWQPDMLETAIAIAQKWKHGFFQS
ncbi:hypothetical protein BH10BAC2_BH10BAC2_25880 [soil metagenome]